MGWCHSAPASGCVEVAIDETGALGMFDVFINNLGARTRRMIDIDARGLFVATQRGSSI